MKCVLAIVLIFGGTVGCVTIGEPTPQEKKQLAAWSAVVTEKDREEVRREADRHTEWMERKRVQWMIDEYRSRYEKNKDQPRRHEGTK